MCQTIELGADLTDLGCQKVIHPDHLVVGEWPAGQAVGAAGRPFAMPEQRHLVGIGSRQGDDGTLFDIFHRVLDAVGGHQVGLAGLIVLAVF